MSTEPPRDHGSYLFRHGVSGTRANLPWRRLKCGEQGKRSAPPFLLICKNFATSRLHFSTKTVQCTHPGKNTGALVTSAILFRSNQLVLAPPHQLARSRHLSCALASFQTSSHAVLLVTVSVPMCFGERYCFVQTVQLEQLHYASQPNT